MIKVEDFRARDSRSADLGDDDTRGLVGDDGRLDKGGAGGESIEKKQLLAFFDALIDTSYLKRDRF